MTWNIKEYKVKGSYSLAAAATAIPMDVRGDVHRRPFKPQGELHNNGNSIHNGGMPSTVVAEVLG